ncbi:MAG: BatA domain-containing protein [Bacteroidia bacterium]|nr:BatA domain-containing protein [Bacteroidia bacterium]
MSFLFPGFLFGLFALSIPIIIHLFNFRRYKKVYFTNVRFLKELKQESESKSKLRQLLILLSRLLAITALVFAFAQPFLPIKNNPGKKTGNKAISVYVDNSFSMEGVGASGRLLDIAKTKARELVKSFGATDRFQLLTNDFEGKHQRLLSRDEFLQVLEEVKLSPAYRNMAEVYGRQKDLLNQSDLSDRRNYIISDFQTSFFDENTMKIKRDSSVSTSVVQLPPNNGGNVFIDTCWFENPVQQYGSLQKMHVRIMNKSKKNLDNAKIDLWINGKLAQPGSFASEPGEKTEVIITYSVRGLGIQTGWIVIEDNEFTYDNKLFFSYNVSRNFPVLLINGDQNKSGQYLRSLLKNDSLFIMTEMNEKTIDFSQFPKNNLIIINEVKFISSGAAQELKKFVSAGGSLAVFPPANAELNSYNDFLTLVGLNTFSKTDTTDQNCERINFEQGFFSDVFEKKQENVDLPKVFSHYSLSRTTRTTEEKILNLMNGLPMLAMYPSAKGKIYLCNTSLDESWSNFSHHALFVPSIYKMVFNSEIPRPLYYETGSNSNIELKKNENAKESQYHVVSKDSAIDFIPETRAGENKTLLFMQGMAKKDGNYSVVFRDSVVAGISFNFPRKESLPEYIPEKTLEDMTAKGGNLFGWNYIKSGEKPLSIALAEIEGGTKLWKLFIILTLVFLAIETALIRLWK